MKLTLSLESDHSSNANGTTNRHAIAWVTSSPFLTHHPKSVCKKSSQ